MNGRIARVVVDISLDKEFDYLVPSHLSEQVKIGSRVSVSFGKTHRSGYVVGLASESGARNLKPIAAVIGDRPLIDDNMLELAKWIGQYYCAPVEKAIRAVLPSAVRRPGSHARTRLFVSLADSGDAKPENAVAVTVKQVAVIKLLKETGGMFLHELTGQSGMTQAPIKSLQKKGLVVIAPQVSGRNPLAGRRILPTKHLNLMPEQATSLEKIRCAVDACVEISANGSNKSDARTTVLLYGVTGSGKTEVYLQAIDYVLGLHRGAIVLVPEISLTPQTVERFVGRFGDRIAVLHSHLSDGERHDEWHRILEGKADVVIGARSAVFAPVRNLGLIVVDEEHESSYKQEDVPRYNARDVAVMRGRMAGCAVVLGSATPAMESWRNAQNGKYELAILHKRADDRKMPVIQIVDMRIEKQKQGHAGVFSSDLVAAISLRLERGEQTILFLNRRGFATSLICPSCGYVVFCDQCSVAMTYHRTKEELCCHICGSKRKVPDRCPVCQDPAFKYAGIGTQRVETIVTKCFPYARVQRMDSDETTRKNSHDRILGDFRAGKTDILIGTQMIAKGLHFPNVTLVGVIYADLSLHMPDFRAGERTFQLLAQVAGRAGRGESAGEVIIQTYTPNHEAIQAVRRMDYEGFCDQDMEFRKELMYPPFAHLVCITLKGSSDAKVSFTAATLARRIGERISRNVIMSKPVPAPLQKAKGQYRYQIMLRCPSTSAIVDPVREVLEEFRFPAKVSASVDVDAISLL